MKVLVTGGGGYIGAHMTHALLDAGVEVAVLDNLSTGFRESVAARASFWLGGVGDRALVRELLVREQVTDVIHFAASTVVPESLDDPAAYYANNTSDALAFFDEAARAGVRRLVLSSTAAVYGDCGDQPVSETHPVAPTSPYGASKAMAERMLTDIGNRWGISTAILRYFNVAGADPQGRCGQSTRHATHLIKVCVEAAVGKRQSVDVFGTDFATPDGTGVRDFIHVWDLVQAHVATLKALRSGRSGLLLNCGYGVGFSVREVIQATQRLSGREIRCRERERRPGDVGSVVADTGRIRRELDWNPEYADLDRIISDALAWERKSLGVTCG